jgi:hypothetical protein
MWYRRNPSFDSRIGSPCVSDRLRRSTRTMRALTCTTAPPWTRRDALGRREPTTDQMRSSHVHPADAAAWGRSLEVAHPICVQGLRAIDSYLKAASSGNGHPIYDQPRRKNLPAEWQLRRSRVSEPRPASFVPTIAAQSRRSSSRSRRSADPYNSVVPLRARDCLGILAQELRRQSSPHSPRANRCYRGAGPLSFGDADE